MFYDGVCLKGPCELLIRVLVSERDDFEDCDVMSLTSQSHVKSLMISPINAP